jgi:hypothetical protein
MLEARQYLFYAPEDDSVAARSVLNHLLDSVQSGKSSEYQELRSSNCVAHMRQAFKMPVRQFKFCQKTVHPLTIATEEEQFFPDILSSLRGKAEKRGGFATVSPSGHEQAYTVMNKRRCVQGNKALSEGGYTQDWHQKRDRSNPALTKDLALFSNPVERDSDPDSSLTLLENKKTFIGKAELVEAQIPHAGGRQTADEPQCNIRFPI